MKVSFMYCTIPCTKVPAMPQSEPSSFPAEFGMRARLQAAQSRFSPSMEKIATLLLENPELPVNLSILELAERAAVSAPTITRFCKLIGYGGYVQLRVGAAADLGRSVGQDGLAGEPGAMVNPAMSDQELVRTFLATHIQALQASGDLVDMRSFRTAAGMIAASVHIDVYGVGGSSSVANGLAERLYQIGINARSWSDLHLGIMSASSLHATAVAIGVSASGSTGETVEMLRMARSAGAKTVAITSDPRSQLADLADVVIRTAPGDDYLDLGALTSSHTQVFAADLLYLLVSWIDPERSQRYAENARAAVQRHKVLGRNRRHPVD
ncbi:MurR/RpiR family transcriptional regulator [Microbacterium sp. dk485]|uniref:MurR/RpiR family transcriptional regulator n=1 Tax=Microbacterium sp. dk485 TaxID=2560021 RepID=UPI0010733B07|nr:MurR/RpiR family transcriptional regulator [Microbacterium sp. dk485]TFV83985.1 MurR/RpiR family transcriptional regulator [Microbacterium sp. dk485]